MFLFHGGVSWMAGGYLGVSTFFTLSGFLITILLLDERAHAGRIAVGRFWERRVRRLLPAAAAGVVLAAVVTVAVGSSNQRRSFVGDATATLLDVANWRFVVVEQSYSALFDAPSALQHAWSLAVEAQFYWLYPLIVIVIMRIVRGNHRWFGAVLVVLMAASVLLTRVLAGDPDRVYYGTDTRGAELRAGALLAVVYRQIWTAGPARITSRRQRLVIDGAGIAAGVAMVVSWIVAPASDVWVGSGALALYAALGALVVLAAATPGSSIERLLSILALQRLGRISYGVYLYHWPILLLLTPDRVPGPPVARLALAAAVTIALAAASSSVLELPIRTHRRRIGQVPVVAMAGLCLVVALAASVVVSVGEPERGAALDAASGSLVSDLDRLGDPPSAGASAPGTIAPRPDQDPARPEPAATGLQPGPITRPDRPLKVVVVGDSVAWELGELLATWGTDHQVWDLARHARIGCGVLRGGDGRGPLAEAPFGPECSTWPDEWSHVIDVVQPDLVILAGGFWDATDRRWPDDPAWRAPGDPIEDERIRSEYTEAVELLTRTGIPLVWLDHPPVFANDPAVGQVVFPQLFDPARMERLDEIQDEIVADRAGVRTVRVQPFLDAWPGGVEDPTLRPDGMHIRGEGALPLIDWLGPQILDAYWEMAPAG